MRPTEAPGAGFAGLFAALKRVRPRRPIHPDGVWLAGTLTRTGPAVRSGVSWIDGTGQVEVRARLSRSVGLPRWSPDILGLAVRIPDGPEHFDVLLASTGASFPARFVLLPRRNVLAAKFTSMMPYKGEASPVLLAAFPLDPGGRLPAAPAALRQGLQARQLELALCFSTPLGSWTRFGTLVLRCEEPDRQGFRFDPVRRPLPGSETYPWTRALREPSYARARAEPGVAVPGTPSRDSDSPTDDGPSPG